MLTTTHLFCRVSVRLRKGPRSVRNKSTTTAKVKRHIGSPPHRAHTRTYMLNSELYPGIRRVGVADAPACTHTARAHSRMRMCTRTQTHTIMILTLKRTGAAHRTQGAGSARSHSHPHARALRIAHGALALLTATCSRWAMAGIALSMGDGRCARGS